MYLVWQDIDPKKSDERKRAEAIARYVERLGSAPAHVYTTEDQALVKATIAPGALWLGPIVDGTRA